MPAATKDFSLAVELDPSNVELQMSLASCHLVEKHWEEALRDLDAAVRLDPGKSLGLRASIRACCPDARYRNGMKAVGDAAEACNLTGWRSGSDLGALAAPYAECGEFDKAVEFQKKAMKAGTGKDQDWVERSKKRLDLYQSNKPCRLDF